MINLENVSLVCVEGKKDEKSILNSIKALNHSKKNINFGEVILISPKLSDELKELLTTVKHYEIDELDWIGYNNFILKNLFNYVKKNYCLIIQWDGFVLNPNRWTDEFFNYDYIGAKWDLNHLKNCNWLKNEVKNKGFFNLVGNGGFSFRSKKLLLETSNSPFTCDGPEDAYICNNNYNYFIEKGIKFGTDEIADKFSREMNKDLSWDSVFGFHGEKDFINKI